ncbi:shikimate kinase [Tenacibaculum sp. MAR_2010_89]|uniref:shikimate kinase n=1 Tax=Tenacibaculum sp. MAR_2010_89 TaxID=1250198 RepID=UPI0008995551|nr:shikimate kinase [Tenacibaculum sp. MAR_2010_89]SEE52240.1 shikimate kinase [Tenacibaculum sp. MAR_2010_89]
MRIFFLGYMASGKSTIGKIVAKKYDLPFIDLDDYIEKKENKTVSEIFQSKGEIYFRKKENEYLKELVEAEDNFVLSLGGGTPCYGNNMDLITKSKNTISFYLRASISTIINRLKSEKEQRPLVANLKNEDLNEFVAKHLFERSYFYNQAKHTIAIDTKEIDEICNEIYSLLT